MGLFDNWPYSNMQELNLDWLLKTMKSLQNIYDGLKEEIQDTIDFVNNFEKNIDEKIDERISLQLEIYNSRLNQLAKELQDLKDELDKDDGVIGMIQALRDSIADLQLKINNTQHLLNDKYLQLLELMHKYKHDLDELVKSKTELLEEYIRETVTKVDRLDVISPVTGLFEPIQKVLDEMYNIMIRSFSVTAEQYDSLVLTANIYDAYRLTAYQYDTHSYFELYFKLTTNLMISPFSGLEESMENIINQLANLHKCPLTAIDYDSREITAQQFDEFRVTAFIYDWFGLKVLRKITAGLYDSLKLEAEQYDNMNIIAEDYDRSALVLYNLVLGGCDSSGDCGNYDLVIDQLSKLETMVNELSAEIMKGIGNTQTISYVMNIEPNNDIGTLELNKTFVNTSINVNLSDQDLEVKEIVTTQLANGTRVNVLLKTAPSVKTSANVSFTWKI